MKEVLMTSKNGNFVLITREGVGMNDTPWKELKILSEDLASKHIIEIRLDSNSGIPNYVGKPVQLTYSDVSIAHGMRMERDTLADTKEYIEVLEEALDFAARVKDFINTSEEWKE